MTRAHAAALSVWVSILGCGPDRIEIGGDAAASETSSAESSTEAGEQACPPAENPLPIPCELERQCPHLSIDQSSYDLETAECILESLRDHRVGSYSFEHYTGFTYANVEFQILGLHAQWARDDFDDTQVCNWSAGISAMHPAEHYAGCLAFGQGEPQTDCFESLFSGNGVGGPTCPSP